MPEPIENFLESVVPVEELTAEFIPTLIGESFDDAKLIAEAEGYEIRPIFRDGEYMDIDSDPPDPMRINVAMCDGIVREILGAA